MAYETLLTRARDGVGVIAVNRPAVRNAMNRRVMDELRGAIDGFREDDGVGAVVFTGAGEKAFVAGADIGELRERTTFDALAATMQRLYDEIEGFEKPTIAAVNGYALGGGCELAMACDIRLASENARFGLPELSLSIIPGAGGTQRLARLVGKGRAVEIILTGRTVDAEEAQTIGLVSKVVPQAELMDVVRETAGQILSKVLSPCASPSLPCRRASRRISGRASSSNASPRRHSSLARTSGKARAPSWRNAGLSSRGGRRWPSPA